MMYIHTNGNKNILHTKIIPFVTSAEINIINRGNIFIRKIITPSLQTLR